MDAGVIGGIIGGVIGLLGGAVGTYFAIHNTDGPKERAFAVRMAVLTWLLLLVFLAGILLLPEPYRWLMWIPYAVFLPLGIRYFNRRQSEIRAEEKRSV